ncbi:hypothetical protein BS47DRAFT_1363585 [Hydnum rufescens UP504]|uniref:Uncharacterized protein n=1 Tax=Hydnum rufescens UP504 TaxID=1448309 RepID=A0A9P6ATN0_9AGAM|nr:hypothetical protein BS47DRAFT_1363585 [Hydnum rufescens UP504]
MYKVIQRKRKRPQRDDSEDSAQTDSDESPPGSGSEDVSAGEESDLDEPLPIPEESSDDELPPISAKTVLSQPIQSDPGGSGRSTCLICPGKILKNGKMVEVHVSSGTHMRRMKRFSTVATTLASESHDTSDDFHVILQLVDAATTDMTPREPKACWGFETRETKFEGKQRPSRRERKLLRKEKAIEKGACPLPPVLAKLSLQEVRQYLHPHMWHHANKQPNVLKRKREVPI